MKKADAILITCALAAAILIYFVSAPCRMPGDTAVIYANGEEYKTLSLSEDSETKVETEGGLNIVVVEGGEVYMSAASCPDRLCVRQGRISKGGETIVCLPHKVVVEVFSAERSGVDAVSE